MSTSAIIIGGGIIGLSSAYYLQKAGWQVSVIDRGDLSNNCSSGNAGYICPSHFTPLAAPGIISQGLKWMLDSRSPFYIKPRLSLSLVQWGLAFMRSATQSHVDRSAAPLRDISLLSMACYQEWQNSGEFPFFFRHDGMLELFHTQENARHARHTVEMAHQLGLDAEQLDAGQVQDLEPDVTCDTRGGVWFKCDAHVNPAELMKNLANYLTTKGVHIIDNESVVNFIKQNNRIQKIITTRNSYDADLVVLAAGAWSRELAKGLSIKLPMVAGRGYSFVKPLQDYPFRHPLILTEGRVAITPMQDQVRFGGTMEITSTNAPPRYKRVEGIVQSVRHFFPGIELKTPADADIWYGYRPCSADGLPYIGHLPGFDNAIAATGHAMLGLSLGAATGLLVSQIANEQQPSVDLQPFEPGRFA
jgi:D-amino-acid dehydrogenase